MKESLKEIGKEFKSSSNLDKCVLVGIYIWSLIQCLILLPLSPFFMWRLAKRKKEIRSKIALYVAGLRVKDFLYVDDGYGSSLLSINGVEHAVKISSNSEAQISQEQNFPMSERHSFFVEAEIKEQDYYELRLFLVRELAPLPQLMEGSFFIRYEAGLVSFKFDPISYWLTAPWCFLSCVKK